MVVVKSSWTCPIDDEYTLHVVAEDRDQSLIVSINQRGNNLRSRETFDLPLHQARSLARWILGLPDDSQIVEETTPVDVPMRRK